MNIPSVITSINNAYKAKKSETSVKSFKNLLEFLEILKTNGYILGYSPVVDKKVKIFLSYYIKGSTLVSIKILSKASYNIYISHKNLWKFKDTLGLLVLSTSHGIISHKIALKKRVGGKVLSYLI